ncbi:MAG TPA: hypothetical protein VFZ91_07040 [Allosphingosinicella sp.]
MLPARKADALAAAEAQLRLRKERIHTMMLIELLALLVFMAMGFAFVSRDEALANPVRDRIARLENLVAERDRRIAELESQARSLEAYNRELAESLRRLIDDPDRKLRANAGLVMLPKARLDELVAENRNKTELIAARQLENKQLRDRLGRGGSDLPNCPVASGRIVEIQAYGDGGYGVTPLWSADAAPAASRVPGLVALTRAGRLSRAEFGRFAAQVKAWGATQTPACIFRARIVERHGNIERFKQQRRFADQYFYTAW